MLIPDMFFENDFLIFASIDQHSVIVLAHNKIFECLELHYAHKNDTPCYFTLTYRLLPIEVSGVTSI